MARAWSLPASRVVQGELLCPVCRRALAAAGEELLCGVCGRRYPIVAGIPDLRLAPDPYISLEDDRAKARRLASAARELSFAELVAHYYAMTPEVPPDLARRYTRHHLAGEQRGEALLERLAAYGHEWAAERDRQVLDLGCGTAGLLLALARRGVRATGIDVALRWLVVAARRLADLPGPRPTLICAGAERLPLADARFDLVVAEGLLEHHPDARTVLAEARRVRRPSGAFLARSVNRFALGPEPHVGLWGVGYLPRRLMGPYVRRRRGLDYRHIHLRSFDELGRLVAASGLRDVTVRAPQLAPGDVGHLSGGPRALLALYATVSRFLPPLRPLLARVGPYVDLVSRPR